MANSADSDQKPTDLNLHCLQRQGISRFSMIRINCALRTCGTTTGPVLDAAFSPVFSAYSFFWYLKLCLEELSLPRDVIVPHEFSFLDNAEDVIMETICWRISLSVM